MGRSPTRQRGVVLIFTLIILLILTIGAVALMRSMNTSMLGAGNLAFRRDLVNQGELAVSTVMAEFQPGAALSSSASTIADNPALNYSASMLAPNSMGVPNILLNDAAFAAAWTAPDLSGAPDQPGGTTSTTAIRYIIDRLCAPGTAAPDGIACVQSSFGPPGKMVSGQGGVAAPTATVYRLTVRVTGARSTQIFLQTTFTRPD